MLSIIVAMDRNRVIGKDNKLPWRLPAEMAYFKQTTMGHPVIMGRKTYESIGKPLPGRRNLIVTRQTEFEAPGCEVVHRPEDAVNAAADAEAFLIGGEQLIRELLPRADRLYITRIDHAFEGDTYFPEIRSEEWKLIREIPGKVDERNPYPYTYCVYERRT